ncbi:MAG: DUF1553 domain-containing protein [Imperialibacter sp.]|uniref:DUF1553 domain-containing protein n=1 Tax=Imperialibacter sp. TaxID=2038411 RepID=UPI0032F09979
MKHLLNYRFLILPAIALVIGLAVWQMYPRKKVDFSTEVKPILNQHCITCHGGVKKNGGFSVLFREEALGNTKSGKPAIIPGHADESELMRRLLANDPEVKMPYKKKPLSDEEIDILRRWIDEGAEWGEHWAYQAVEKPELPAAKSFASLKESEVPASEQPIDLFIRKKLSEVGLQPSPEAPKDILLRRVSLDLTGLPPSDELVEAFLTDGNPMTYEEVVDALLADPAYGERWTAMWLDLARYADTKGYERDPGREIWHYRDWLIKAFNEDKPYDDFLIEQLAGDLLPNPTDDQLIATAFHRNTMTNDEGGTDNEEFRVAAVLDRVNTTWEVLMGTTFACVQCHSHPYDPIRHEDYYRFAAFFNNTRDEDTYDEYPLLRHFETEDSTKLASLKNWLEENATTAKTKEVVQFVKTWQPAINSITADEFVDAELADTKWLVFRNHGVARLPGVELTARNLLTYRYRTNIKDGTWTIRLDDQESGSVLKELKMKDTGGKWVIDTLSLTEAKGRHHVYLSYESPSLTSPAANGIFFDWFHFSSQFPEGEAADEAQSTYWELVNAKVETTPIMVENPPGMARESQVFERGNWLVKGGKVEPGVPEVFPDLPDGAPANRLGMAMWLTDPANPLTARTIINRLWEQLYGQGLAETLEDLGSQGIEPTHPELLDYLAWQLVNDHDWSLKQTLKTMVMSATYRQSSVATDDVLEADQFNQYYARAPRTRLSAEQLRDQALAVSGLLSSKMYGPSVMPYQPKGIWNSAYSNADWKQSEGEDQYRRGVYTYWKRTSAYPAMLTFDATAREVCVARRIRTNTPLQALVLLNDSVYVEAANHLALNMIKAETGTAGQIAWGYKAAMKKPITPMKSEALEKLYDEALKGYEGKDSAEAQAMQLVAAAILNLDEFVTRN